MPPKLCIHDEIVTFMKNRNSWDETLRPELPNNYEKFGDTLLFNAPAFSSEQWSQAGDSLWHLICNIYKGKSIGLKQSIKNDNFRTPQAKLVYGSPITHFIDNKIKFSWNIEKNMFCVGNVTERHRIATLDCSDEVIVDLFAGIGYFTVPYLVHAKAKYVHACEWNPDAIEALKNNLLLNKVSDRCTVYFGDNKEVCPKGVANRVNLGLIPSSEGSWQTACDALINSGGILYVHENVTSNLSSPKLQCLLCKDILKTVNINVEDCARNRLFPLLRCSKVNGNFVGSIDGDFNINVKMLEWFYFSIHLSHTLIENFEKSHNNKCIVGVREIFKVKSYAPHIDHLVLSAHCLPS